MSESDKNSLEDFLVEEARKREHIEDSIEAISQILEANASRAIEAYEAERRVLLPEAQEKLTNVVVPWWQDFEESGTYRRVFEYLSQRDFGSGINPVATLSELIVFPWPRISTPQNVEEYARYSIDRQKGDLEKSKVAAVESYEAHDALRNLWTAHFYVAGEHQFRHDPGFGISRWPMSGGSFAYAMTSARSNDIHLYRVEADQLITKIHPEVIIGFAEQIENGQVYRRLQASLQPSTLGSRQTIRIGSEEHARRQEELARQYWNRKQARQTG